MLTRSPSRTVVRRKYSDTGRPSQTWAEARQLAFNCAAPIPPRQVSLADAIGQTLATDVTAIQALPHYASSAMDGWAVHAAAPGGQPADVVITTGGTGRSGTDYSGMPSVHWAGGFWLTVSPCVPGIRLHWRSCPTAGSPSDSLGTLWRR